MTESIASWFVDAKYLGLAQAYRIEAVPTHGTEVFSLSPE